MVFLSGFLGFCPQGVQPGMETQDRKSPTVGIECIHTCLGMEYFKSKVGFCLIHLAFVLQGEVRMWYCAYSSLLIQSNMESQFFCGVRDGDLSALA